MITKISQLKRKAEPILDLFEEGGTFSTITLHSKTVPSISLTVEVNHTGPSVTIKSNPNNNVVLFSASDKNISAQKIKEVITDALLVFDKTLERKLNSLHLNQRG